MCGGRKVSVKAKPDGATSHLFSLASTHAIAPWQCSFSFSPAEHPFNVLPTRTTAVFAGDRGRQALTVRLGHLPKRVTSQSLRLNKLHSLHFGSTAWHCFETSEACKQGLSCLAANHSVHLPAPVGRLPLSLRPWHAWGLI